MCLFADKTILFISYFTIINISMNKFNKVFKKFLYKTANFLSHFIIINFSMIKIVLIKY